MIQYLVQGTCKSRAQVKPTSFPHHFIFYLNYTKLENLSYQLIFIFLKDNLIDFLQADILNEEENRY